MAASEIAAQVMCLGNQILLNCLDRFVVKQKANVNIKYYESHKETEFEEQNNIAKLKNL